MIWNQKWCQSLCLDGASQVSRGDKYDPECKYFKRLAHAVA